jgi:hypothetical protein
MRVFQLFLRVIANHVRHAHTADGRLVCDTQDVERWLLELSHRMEEFKDMKEFLEWFATKPQTGAAVHYDRMLKEEIKK